MIRRTRARNKTPRRWIALDVEKKEGVLFTVITQ
jgi:hypothetical protein